VSFGFEKIQELLFDFFTVCHAKIWVRKDKVGKVNSRKGRGSICKEKAQPNDCAF
jgi:hypothetical protein